MNSAVIVAGGNGSRFGQDIPKQFYKLNGKEILSYSVSTFCKHPQIDEVVIVCHSDWIEHVKSKYPECIVTVGGKRRQDSSLNGVMTTSHKTEIVLIHDAARPFVSEEIITDCLAALKNIKGTDEIGMVLKLFPDSRLNFVSGSPLNIKITTDLDLHYFSNFPN